MDHHAADERDAHRLAAAERRAAALADAARAFESAADRRQRRRIGALVADEASRQFLMDLTDQVLRIGPPRRAAARLADLVAERGLPAFAGPADRLALRAGAALVPAVPGIVMALARLRLEREFSSLVLPAEERRLAAHLARRSAQAIHLNLNLLGEAVLGDDEARRRLEGVVALLQRPEVDYVSVKISSICAQLDVSAYEHSLERIVGQLRRLFRAAAGFTPAKFVNLDMEEYRDLHLTIDAFTRVLGEAEFAGLDAGIVLQAYLPDSYAALERLAAFARARHARSASIVKVRLVKGANLAMERVEAELRGWEQAPFSSKAEVDANYKRLIDLALEPENRGALRVGVASHNLFDIAWALERREEAGATEAVEIEMLEGMANPQARAVAAEAGGLLLYAPIVRRQDFESAVAYLVRRFDENTAPENFLAQLFDLVPGSARWASESARFAAAVAARREAPMGPRRHQDRRAEEAEGEPPASGRAFTNAADTDFTLAANRAWLADHLEKWSPVALVPARVDVSEVPEPASGVGVDPSAPETALYRYVEADAETVRRAVATARRSAESWRALEPAARAGVLEAIADELGRARGELLAVMARDAAKTAGEGDAEVSEAVDYARYYAEMARELPKQGAAFDPYRVVVVTPPWNFPLAIPAGGVLAALAAGASVILKPAPEAVLTAWTLAQACWAGGVPGDVLQFVPTADDEVGRLLVSHDDVDAVILTGAYDTARLFLSFKPELRLHAETSGKNAIVITAAADQDDAIRDLVRSAFFHAGQKCSAASLALIEAPLYDDERFLERLADSVRSLRVGPAADPATQVGPLIRPPSPLLAGALRRLERGERWLVEPRQLDEVGYLWSPGVKLGVSPGSEFHRTEYFGPVLGLMRVADLDEAIAFQNAVAYGLTGGIHSLDDAEVDRWLERVEVGNAYVNRHITGAIVRRQPFGGWKRSAIGPGAKAGGPHYVASLGTWRATGPVDVAAEIDAATRTWERLARGEDPSGLTSEANVFRLRRLASVALRFGAAPAPDALAVSLGVAAAIGVPVLLSTPRAFDGLPEGTVIEGEPAFLARLEASGTTRVRLVGGDLAHRLELMDRGLEVDIEPLSPIGERELFRYSREQAISETRHRHGDVRPARRR
ncbi:MAG: bifunctional proline dehydrogenase/L-glutamate gamma-semialdehyde dehydrogenase [Actinomycetota bacterium]|nr:bifunctional proline dehydrogenase/L-glutamate gamma-semialdehyde dehydrogenase [Actinomycetota bacterium]